MSQLTMRDLLEAGVHFGHQTRRWNPKMRRFIFAERQGIYIIDLQKTLQQIEHARDKIQETVRRGQEVLFVCTKRQLREIVREEADRCGAFYVTNRWLGGTLTNFRTIKKNLQRLRDLERMEEMGELDILPKKEIIRLRRQREKLEKTLGGIKLMEALPAAMYVVDAKRERIAVNEANRSGIPIVAIVDTNADPDLIDIPIAGNDDAIRSVRLITHEIAEAVLNGKAERREAEEAAVVRQKEAMETVSYGGEEEEDVVGELGLEEEVAREVRRVIKRPPKEKRTVEE